jgi:hypothetical protein
MFICNHCPFVKHQKKDIAKLTSFYMEVRTLEELVKIPLVLASKLTFENKCRRDLVLSPYLQTPL